MRKDDKAFILIVIERNPDDLSKKHFLISHILVKLESFNIIETKEYCN